MNGINHFHILVPSEAEKMLTEGTFLIDIRPAWEYAFKRINFSDVLSIPYKDINANLALIPKNRRLIIMDTAGVQSRMIAKELFNQGFSDLFVLAGGIVAWERSGLPLLTNVSEKLTGSCMCQLKPRLKRK